MGMVAGIIQGAGQASAGIVEGGFTAIAGAQAAKRAGRAQMAGASEAMNIQRRERDKSLERSKEAEERARADLQPFAGAGREAMVGLQEGLAGSSRLVSDPNAQRQFIQDNPFFDALAERSTRTLFQNQAARGKLGSGQTAEALQNSILLLGSDLLNQNLQQRAQVNKQFQGLVNTGLNAATSQAGISERAGTTDVSTRLDVANQLADLRTQSANAQAASIMGRFNARNAGNIRASQGALQGLSTVTDSFGGGGIGGMMGGAGGAGGGGFSLCDIKAKENIKRVGKLNNGLNVYTFNYKGDDTVHMNVMAQEVERVNPDAVKEIDGLKYVNMEAACQ